MIEKLQIRDYGSNKKIDLEFGEHITTIMGKSFIGKSWILRALRWVALNKPAGDSFINWDGEKANVRLIVDDKKIIRTRGKSINTYRLGKKEVYKAFGNEVPRDIAKTLNLSDINFQGVNILGQHEPPFWFCETAGEVSRQLNAIVNLDVIDSTLSNISSELRKAKTTIEIIQEKLAWAIAAKKKLAYIDDLNEELLNVEQLQELMQGKAVECTTINNLLETSAKYRKTADIARARVTEGEFALAKGKIYYNTTIQVQKLLELIETAIQLQEDIKTRPPSLKPIEILKKAMEGLTIQYSSLYDLIETIKYNKEKKCQAIKELYAFEQKLEKATKGKCPVCGRPMKN